MPLERSHVRFVRVERGTEYYAARACARVPKYSASKVHGYRATNERLKEPGQSIATAERRAEVSILATPVNSQMPLESVRRDSSKKAVVCGCALAGSFQYFRISIY